MSTTTSKTSSSTPIALVTGGSRGLGRSIALHLADSGVDVVFTYRSAEKEAKEVADAIRAKGRKVAFLRLEVGDTKGFGAFAESLRAELARTFQRDRFDFLVNNAGVGIHAPIATTTEAQFDELMNVHFKGTFFLTQTMLPIIADGGRILNVTTGLDRFTFPGYGAYASMKGAIEVFTRYLAKELGERKIAVNAIAPGAIETDFGGGTVRDNAQVNQMIAGQTALGRVGLPDDIGGAVSLLLGPGGGWITGQRIEVSGGMML